MPPFSKELSAIAKTHLGFSSLKDTNSDRLDFKEVSKASVRAALEAAYALGKTSRKTKKRPRPGRLLTGKELKFAAKNKIPVWYTERYFNQQDQHLNFHKEVVMEKAQGDSYYIGNSDITPNDYRDEDPVDSEFDEGVFSVRAAPGQNYQQTKIHPKCPKPSRSPKATPKSEKTP
jgi:hypothetical protein